MTAPSTLKGRLLEQVVAELHRFEGLKVSRSVRLPSVKTPGRLREIDVLLESQVAGYPVRIAIECKNEAQKLDPEYIDAFAGKLDDVGIPRQHGVYVAANGYTTGAVERAAADGMKTLTLSGLAPDRLSSLVSEVLLSTVYLLAEIVRMSVPIVDSGPDHPLSYVDSDGNTHSGVPHVVWQKWVSGELDMTIGKHLLVLKEPPPGLFLCSKDVPRELQIASVIYRVRGFVLVLRGSGTHHVLLDAATKTIEKVSVSARIETPGRLEIPCFDSEEQVSQLLAANTGLRMHYRVPVPRIVCGQMYWPVSQEALERAKQRLDAGLPPDFREVEGADFLSNAWHPKLDVIVGRG